MTICHAQTTRFPRSKGRLVETSFNGADVTSDGGIMLVRQADKRLRLTERIAAVLDDRRRQASCRHTRLSLIRQGVFGLAMGDEDLNDHQEWRHDGAVQAAVETDQELASASTLCRFEQQASREDAVALHQVLLQQFIESFPEPPQRLILDVDATDDRVHGNQEGKCYHGYYHDDCFLPLSVFCGSQPLVAYLRQSNQDPARHAGAVLALLVRALRAVWPKGEIVFRGTGGSAVVVFCLGVSATTSRSSLACPVTVHSTDYRHPGRSGQPSNTNSSIRIGAAWACRPGGNN